MLIQNKAVYLLKQITKDMELPIKFKEQADKNDFSKEERGAYLYGAQEVLNAVEAEVNYLKSLASSNGRIYVDDVLKLLSAIKPLNT